MPRNKRIYVGTHDGVCAVVSHDGGDSWELGPVTFLPHAAARLSASRVNPLLAYLAAYEAGVYRTADGGLSWQKLESYPTPYAHSVLAHPTEGDSVLVGSEPATVFRSWDGGDTWEELEGFQAIPEASEWGFHSPTRDSHVRDLRVAVGNANLLFAGIEVGGMVCSQDGGGSWRQLPGLDPDIHCINLAEGMPGRVYVATASTPYRSDDGGSRWEMINNGIDRRYTLHIASAPDGPNVVLVTVSENARRGNPKFYRSTDGGESWNMVEGLGQGESPAEMVVAFDWDPEEAGRVYAGTDGGGLFQSRDDGRTWEELPVRLGHGGSGGAGSGNRVRNQQFAGRRAEMDKGTGARG